MKIKQDRLYPYPVYSQYSDDYKDNRFTCDVDLEYDSETASVKLEIVISDDKLYELVEDNNIGIYCHIECSSTKYRELFEIIPKERNISHQIDIPLYQLNDTVEVLCVLVAKENIEGFADENLNDLYIGESITFPMYATIGYTDTTELTLTKRIDTNGDVPSIFAMCCDETGTALSYSFDGDQIVVYLPKEEYLIYESYKGLGVRLKQMMLNIPVLVDVLNYVKANENEISDKAWYPILEAAYQKKGFTGFDDTKFTSKDSVSLAQMILGDITKDAFAEFDKMNREK